MKQRTLLCLLVLLTLAIACNGEQRATPTPFSADMATEEAVNLVGPQAISITDLATDPEAFNNSFVKITGRYHRLPLLICKTDPHPAPATWQLQAEDGSLVAIGGFDSQVRSLLPTDLTMTVAGVWQLFDGPVGCGKNASTAKIWYLKASDILSPSPIAQVTLTPTGNVTQIAATDGETAVTPVTNDDGSVAATPTPVGNVDNPNSTPTLAGTIGPGPSGSTPTFTAVPPTSSSGGGDDSSTVTPTATTSASSGTATPTSGASASPTAASGTATPTSSSGTGGNPTPTSVALTTATRNPNNFEIVEFDDLSPEIPVLELLAPEEAHLYPILFEYNGVITITAIAEPSVNLVLEIIDPADDVVEQANNGGNGELEAINNAALNVALDYKIRVYDLNGTEGDYCLVFNEEGGFPDSIKGLIAYGQTRTSQIEEFAINYWCFLGSDGDNLSATVSPTGGSGDFLLALYGPPDFAPIGSAYASATIMNAGLEENGMYILGILNDEIDPAAYSINLTKN